LSFHFDEPIAGNTLDLNDVVSFTGPGGADLRSQILRWTVSGSQATVHFRQQFAPGAYTLTVGPDIRDLADNPMDQNGDEDRVKRTTRLRRPSESCRRTWRCRW